MECHHNIINKTTITINTTTNTILVTRAIIRSLQKTRGLVILFQLKIINLSVSGSFGLIMINYDKIAV